MTFGFKLFNEVVAMYTCTTWYNQAALFSSLEAAKLV